MASDPNPTSNNNLQHPQTTTPGSNDALKNFAIGVFFSGLPIFVYLITSVYMTHSSFADVGSLKMAIAIFTPLLCGILAVFFKDRVTNVLTGMLESLPF